MSDVDSLPSLTSSQRFQPQDDDEETLWEVHEITAEKGKKYKVRWKGDDPKTMKPWPQSWVMKEDCTDDLVRDWRRRVLERKEEEAKRKKRNSKARLSTASKKSARASTSTAGSPVKQVAASSSKITRRSTSTAIATASRPVRMAAATPTYEQNEDDSGRTATKANGKKRKLADATSANSSANNAARQTSVDVNVTKDGGLLSKAPVTRPKKKRKIVVEITRTKEESESEAEQRRYLTDTIKTSGPPADYEDEYEERMVEDALSESGALAEAGGLDDVGPPAQIPLFLPPSHNSTTPSIKIGPPLKSRPSAQTNNKSKRKPQPQVTQTSDSQVFERPTQYRSPTEERSVFWVGKDDDKDEGDEDDNAELQYPVEPVRILSPGALERLARFDEEVMNVHDDESEPSPLVVPQTEAIASGKPELAHPGDPAAPPDFVGSSKWTKTPRTALPPSHKAKASRGSKPPSNEYTEVVPETDESQEQELRMPVLPSNRMASKSPLQREPHSPPRNATSGPSKAKKMQAIPVLSPSVFYPHLPAPVPSSSLPAPSSSLPEDISDELSQRALAKNADEDEAPMSSIEQFDSPEKRPARIPVVAPKPSKGKARESASDIWHSDIVRRGQEIAEAAKRSRDALAGAPPPPPKKSLNQVIAETRARSNSALSGTGSERMLLAKPMPTPIPEDEEDMDVDVGGVSTDVVPSASEPQATLDQTLWEMEQAYVDLSGGVDDSREQAGPNVEELREEEEESTQDIMAELEEMRNQQRPADDDPLERGWGAKPTIQKETPIVEKEKTPTVEAGDNDRATSEIVVSPAMAEPLTNGLATLPARVTRSRSTSRTPLPAPTRATSKDKRASSILRTSVPPQTRSKRGTSVALDPVPEVSVAPQTNNDELTQAIATLQAALAVERAKNAELILQRDTAAQAHADSIRQCETAAEERISQLENERKTEKDAWENEKLQLSVQLDSAVKAKTMADNDRDFFREQYAKASGFVSAIRDENKDLEKRVEIAEEQTRTGVNLVRATFEQRNQSLEADRNSWRTMAEFLIQKDRRTDNDDLRRRAAEHPELQKMVERQEAIISKAQERIFALEANVVEHGRNYAELEASYQGLKDEMTGLTVQLDEALIKLDRVGRSDGYGDTSMDTTENGHEFVYACKWRTESNELCREVFPTISELEQHLTVPGGHLNIV